MKKGAPQLDTVFGFAETQHNTAWRAPTYYTHFKDVPLHRGLNEYDRREPRHADARAASSLDVVDVFLVVGARVSVLLRSTNGTRLARA